MGYVNVENNNSHRAVKVFTANTLKNYFCNNTKGMLAVGMEASAHSDEWAVDPFNYKQNFVLFNFLPVFQ